MCVQGRETDAALKTQEGGPGGVCKGVLVGRGAGCMGAAKSSYPPRLLDAGVERERGQYSRRLTCRRTACH